MAILEVKNIAKNFGELKVLKDISFNVEQGQVVAIIGPSGSGKSTLLRCINQLEKADSGEITVDGTKMMYTNENGKTVYALCKKYEIPIVLNTDAHYAGLVGKTPIAEQLLRDLDFPRRLIVNLDADYLMELAHQKRNIHFDSNEKHIARESV